MIILWKQAYEVARTLVDFDEKDHPDYLAFIEEKGIRHIRINVPTNKQGYDNITAGLMGEIQLIIRERNGPMLVHCNKGKVRNTPPSLDRHSCLT